jgi:hypothetical protein
MKETCTMTFRTSHGRNRVVSVAAPRAGLTAATVGNAASMIMASNPFDAETGTLDRLLRADLVSVTRTAIIAAADVA